MMMEKMVQKMAWMTARGSRAQVSRVCRTCVCQVISETLQFGFGFNAAAAAGYEEGEEEEWMEGEGEEEEDGEDDAMED